MGLMLWRRGIEGLGGWVVLGPEGVWSVRREEKHDNSS